MDFKSIEAKWQKAWEESKIFEVKESKKKKQYILEMFPYPSGSTLHMGHAFNYTIGDIYARFKIMQGYNVLHPMGFDSFGLPAENAAIKEKSHPKVFIDSAVTNYIKFMKKLGFSYDWSRVIKTSDPEYYKWNQYFFLKFLENGLVYKKEARVNWCPECTTVLANEQVQEGKCWRHTTTQVIEKSLEQWFIKTTKYAEELLKDIDKLNWPERIKVMQKNWIGKSQGTLVKFPLENQKGYLDVFTTRIDTLFSVTFLVMAPEHPLVHELVKGTNYENETSKFINRNILKEKFTRTSEEKEGVFIGRYAINPATNQKIPIYLANFVVMDYGTGIVMADAHDKRDVEFAKKYKIPLVTVLKHRDGTELKKEEIYEEYGILINSGQFSGLSSEEAIPKIQAWLSSKKLAKKTVQYKLRDWLISRQRYWGTPIPIIYCSSCGMQPVPEKDLPVKLPEKVVFGKGNPLETNKEFVNTNCPKCKKPAKRETDTMDTFFDSSWYFLRYIDSKNTKKPFDKEKQNYWMPIDQYIGGAEHACMHLIYARFFTKALRDLGYVSMDEPFTKLFNQGMLHKDGVVMSKSKGNIVVPDEVSEKYGMDTARLFLVSNGSPDKDTEWSDKGVEGSARFLNKFIERTIQVKKSKSSERMQSKLHQTIKGVTEDIENFQYNLAIIKIRELVEYLEPEISKSDLEIILKLMSPFCPHIAEELWGKIGNKPFISLAKWPKYESKKINAEFEEIDKLKERVKEDLSAVIKLVKFKPKKVTIYLAESWKYEAVKNIKLELERTRNMSQIMSSLSLKEHQQEIASMVQSFLKNPVKMPNIVLSQKKEIDSLKEILKALNEEFNLTIEIKVGNQKAMPAKPAIHLE